MLHASFNGFGIYFLEADLSQNIVYQNEDGKWVTDLAYYTSFTDQQDLQMSPNNETNEDFRSGSKYVDNQVCCARFMVYDDVFRLVSLYWSVT